MKFRDFDETFVASYTTTSVPIEEHFVKMAIYQFQRTKMMVTLKTKTDEISDDYNSI